MLRRILVAVVAFVAVAVVPAGPAQAMDGGTIIRTPTPATRATGFITATSRKYFTESQCTGTLIAPTWVLTAQHCLEHNYPGTSITRHFPVNEVRVAFNRLNKSGTTAAQRSDVVEILRMPDYSHKTGYNDVALLRLQMAPPGVVPVALPTGPVDWKSLPLEIAGWGETDMQHVAPARTPELLGGFALTTRPGTPYGLLVGGDSGGPLFATFVGRSYQVGLNVRTVDKRGRDNDRNVHLRLDDGPIPAWLSRSIPGLRGGTAVKLASALDRPAAREGEVFYDRTWNVRVDGTAAVFLSASADGTAPFSVDDIIDITVVTSTGSTRRWERDFSLNCNATVDSRAAENIRTLFEPGVNTMRVVLSDWCGYDIGNSDLWMTGVTSATPR